jgi:hypothetical protein
MIAVSRTEPKSRLAQTFRGAPGVVGGQDRRLLLGHLGRAELRHRRGVDLAVVDEQVEHLLQRPEPGARRRRRPGLDQMGVTNSST